MRRVHVRRRRPHHHHVEPSGPTLETLAPALIEALDYERVGDILGGVIPPKDYDFLKRAGSA
jgi:hypothetical protein